jgi:hypothetical protein
MRYMLLIHMEEKALTEDEREECYAESTRLIDDLRADGKFLDAAPLLPVAMTSCVRVREGRRVVTDGPFVETREQLGGYFLIDANDLDEAVEIAGRIPGARKGTVEIRPVKILADTYQHQHA